VPAGAVLTGAPQGQQETLEANIKAYNEARASVPQLRGSLNAGKNAWDALQLAGNAGPGTAWQTQWSAWAQAHGLPIGQQSVAYQEARKYLLNWARSQVGGGPSTDLGLETTLHANPNIEDMLMPAVKDTLLNGMGTARQRLAMIEHAPPGGYDFPGYQQQYLSETDPRGFTWNMRDAADRARIAAAVGADPNPLARKRLTTTLGRARDYDMPSSVQ
jgi:hypothetical protein